MHKPAAFIGPKGIPAPSVREQIIGKWLFDGTFPMPTAVLRSEQLNANISTMSDFCAHFGLLLAPHAKTTMSPELIQRQLRAGAWGMTVATAWQAGQVAAMGVQRILIANEVSDGGSLHLLQQVLAERDDMHLWCYVDSVDVLDRLGSLAPFAGRIGLLVEFGIKGGRTGVRTPAEAITLARIVARGPFHLAGISGFEGLIGGSDLADGIAQVDAYLEEMARIARTAWDESLLSSTEFPIVTVGGSAYPDRVALCLVPALSGLGINVVLRSGCYISHDSLAYDACSPFGSSPRLPYALHEALEVWAPILSTPEDGRAIASMGRRDCSFDAGLPVARRLLKRSEQVPVSLPEGEASPITVVALNDQHAYLDVRGEPGLQVGDLVGFGISHPCTTFDKWGTIPIVNQRDVVVDIATTRFT